MENQNQPTFSMVILLIFAFFFITHSPAKADVTDLYEVDKEWRNAALISHPYGRDLNNAKDSIHLSLDEHDQPVFEIIDRTEKTNDQPHHILWTMEIITNTKFFRLRNLDNDKYLVREPGTQSVMLTDNPATNDENAQWFVQSLTVESDLSIINRSDDQIYALYMDGNQSVLGTNYADASLKVIADADNPANTEHLFRISSRFLEVEMTPTDMELGTCLVHLTNGVPMEGFFTPSPATVNDPPISREFKITIRGFGGEDYVFSDHIGFDPLASNLNAEQQALLTRLRNRVDKMRIVVEENLDPNEVFDSFMDQLSEAYRNDDSAAMIYFPQSLTDLRADTAAGKIFKAMDVLEDYTLAYRVTTLEPLSSTYAYAFLVTRPEVNGSPDFLFVDPTDTSKPSRPR